MVPDFINIFIKSQIDNWSLANKNYKDLREINIKTIEHTPYNFQVQFNPKRARSTTADISSDTLKQNKCFLCDGNRPSQQNFISICEDRYKILINPYPIFPNHLTIVSSRHIPQVSVTYDIFEITKILKGMAVFFNGAKAGASAPHHHHYQAVEKEFLPIINYIENNYNSPESYISSNKELNNCYPFLFFTGIIKKGEKDIQKFLEIIVKTGGKDIQGKFSDTEMSNSFFWIDMNDDFRFLLIPRSNHRPSCYFETGVNRLIVSPGAIDMAGVIITVRYEDFEKIDYSKIMSIYKEISKG